jgi:hypothetical protein
MTAQEPIDLADIPSLKIVERTLTREEDSFRLRAHAIDTKAGLLLSASGVLIALVGGKPSLAGLVAQLFSMGAGGVAVAALWPRVDKGIGPRELRDRYLTTPATVTRLVLLNTRIDLHAKDEEHLIKKARRLRVAALLLLSAALAVVLGAIVQVFRS